jgi:hypothetical protein
VSSSVAVNKIDSAFHRLLVSLASLSASNTTSTSTTTSSTTSTAAVESALAELDRLLIALQLDHCSPKDHRHDNHDDNTDDNNDNNKSARSR